MEHLTWGWLIALYLFLAGAGAGAFLAAAAGDILAPEWSKSLSKAGSILSAPLIIIGCLFLVLDLGAGKLDPSRLFYLFANFDSWITRGTIILSVFIPVGLIYALLVNEVKGPWEKLKGFFRVIEVAGIVLSFATAIYTGILIGVINAIPFWNNSILPVLFVVSALSTGLAGAMVMAAVMDRSSIKGLSNLSLAHIILISLELGLLAILLIISQSSVEGTMSVGMLLSGALSGQFWLLVVALGMIIPIIISIFEFRGHGQLGMKFVLIADFSILIGGLFLRYLVLAAGVPLLL